jgi:hypothetical protein
MESNSVVEFLNRELLEKALRTYKNDGTIEILNFEISLAFGEHYGSQMYRSKVDFKSKKYPSQRETQSIAVVIKIKPPGDSDLSKITEGGPLFETEIEMYKNVLPTINELYQRNGQKIEFAPE